MRASSVVNCNTRVIQDSAAVEPHWGVLAHRVDTGDCHAWGETQGAVKRACYPDLGIGGGNPGAKGGPEQPSHIDLAIRSDRWYRRLLYHTSCPARRPGRYIRADNRWPLPTVPTI